MWRWIALLFERGEACVHAPHLVHIVVRLAGVRIDEYVRRAPEPDAHRPHVASFANTVPNVESTSATTIVVFSATPMTSPVELTVAVSCTSAPTSTADFCGVTVMERRSPARGGRRT